MKTNLLRYAVLASAVVTIGILTTGCGSGSPDADGAAQAEYGHSDAETDATQVYGRARVKATGGEFVHYQSAYAPWSGDYYPSNETTLFAGQGFNQAPLQKYDAWVAKVYRTQSSAADFERQFLYTPDDDSSQGRCDAFAKASIMEPEPTTPVKVDGISFGVGDQKALLVEAYTDADGFPTYGARQHGDGLDDPARIYPDQFHRIIQAELIEKGQPFIVDKRISGQVWNLPVYQVSILAKKDPSNPYVLHVTTYLGAAWYVEGNPDFVGTSLKVIDPAYTYDLYGIPQEDGTLEVYWGQWTGRSKEIHPDFVVTKPPTGRAPALKSLNEQINPKYVQEILTKARSCRTDRTQPFCQ